jgi:hypothetical protein
MAGKKKKSTQPTPEEMIQQRAQEQAVLDRANSLMEENQMIQHQLNNKAHDTEFTEYSDIRGDETLKKITDEDVKKAWKILMEYKNDKARLENNIIENEEFWKMNHWDVLEKGADDKRVKPKSAWLFNMIINKHADAMDNFPEPNILPRVRDDEETAKALSCIVPVVLEQNDYESTYSDCQWYKEKQGTSVQAVLWNNDKSNGLGDIEVKKVDLLNLFWKGGISDIQESPNVFHVVMKANDELRELYPELQLGESNLGLTMTEAYNLGTNTSDESVVVDWYYRKRFATLDELGVPKMMTVLHYCKFCNGQVIYASENDPKYTETGWYNHGMYPFVFDTLYPIEGSVTGIGYIDIEKDDQLFIDKGQQAILESMVTNARPRYFFRNDGKINEQEFLDLSSPIVHVDGSLNEDSILPIQNSQFNGVYESILLNKIEELKDTSGNTAASQGQASSVTSASGIASLQEAAGKLSRDSNNTSYRAYKKVVELVIELIRQFYDEPRCFRIVGDDGKTEFVDFDNSGLLPQDQGRAVGINLGDRLPVMDIVVKPQKKSAYTKEAQNQTALNLYSMGFFNPQNTDSALACLSMMEFDQIDKVRDTIKENGTLYQMVIQMQQQIAMYQQQLMQMGSVMDAAIGTNVAQSMEGQAAAVNQANQVKEDQSGKNGGSTKISKGSLSTQAAAATRGSTSPR